MSHTLVTRYMSCTLQPRVVASTSTSASGVVTRVLTPLQTATLHGQQHLIVPVVALVGNIVLQAANAPAPEFVPVDVLYTFRPATWNLRPVLPTHPQNLDGVYVSAKSPGVYDKYAFGVLFNTRVEGGKLLTDAWINLSRAAKVNASDVITRLQTGEVVEVSVGVNVLVDDTPGVYNGDVAKGSQRYAAKWVEVIDSDHLAMLPVGVEGACSVADGGCGAGKVNSETGRRANLKLTGERSMSTPFNSNIRSMLQQALAELQTNIIGGISSDTPYIYIEDFNDTTVIYSVGPSSELFERSYTMDGDKVVLGNDEKQAKKTTTYEPVSALMRGLSFLGQLLAPAFRTDAGARHSAKDQSMIQSVHDASKDLGADCPQPDDAKTMTTKVAMTADTKSASNTTEDCDPEDPECECNPDNPDYDAVNCPDDSDLKSELKSESRRHTESRVACACQDNQSKGDVTAMSEKEKKALVGKLIAAGKFKEDQRKVLEATDDGVLQMLGTSIDPDSKTVEVKPLAGATPVDPPTATTPTPTPAPAPTSVATAVKPLSEAEWLASAPPAIRTLVARSQAEENARRANLISALSTADTLKGKLTVAQLTAKSTEDLELLSTAAGVSTPAYDYSGQFAPLQTAEELTVEEKKARDLRRKPLTASREAYQAAKRNRAA